MDSSLDNGKGENKEIFDFKLENTVYSIEISKTNKETVDSITFTAFNKNYISNMIYQKSFNLEQLITISNIFKLCNNINDAFDIIKITFKNNEIKISKDDKIYLCISFKLPTGKYDEIKIGLEKTKAPDNVIIEKICQNLSEVQLKNKKLEDEIQLLKTENQKLKEQLNKQEEVPTLINIMEKKFAKSRYLLTKDLSTHLKEFGLKDDFKDEIINKFESKAKLVYDVKRDGDTLVGFMSKVFGRANIASFHALHGDDKYLSVQLAYLNGKLEFINNYFNFENNDLFTYGNYQVYEGDFCYTSFKAQNSKLYVKIEFDCIYVIFYENDSINFIIKIRDNFVNNLILYLDEPNEKITKFFEENSEDKVADLFNSSTSREVNLTELQIYQIED